MRLLFLSMALLARAATSDVTVTQVGDPGQTGAFYVVVAKLASSQVISPVAITGQSNRTLGSKNYNSIKWIAVSGAISYDVLKLASPTMTNPAMPTFIGTCSACALAIGIKTLSADDKGEALADYK